jgi:hypothetical protein
MSSHISIGVVFARAWTLFRRRFIVLLALNLLQSFGLSLAVFWRDLTRVLLMFSGMDDIWVAMMSPGIRYGTMAMGSIIFVLASIGMMLATRQSASLPSLTFWPYLLRRFLSTTVAIALCLAVIALIFYGWSLLLVQIPRGTVGLRIMIWITLVTALVMIGFSSLVFLTLPAAVLEAGGPLKAIRRSLFLTAGHRWRLIAICLILLAGLALAVVFWVRSTDSLAALFPGLLSSAYVLVSLFTLLTAILLVLTLVIASAYHLMVRLKDGIRAEDAGIVFE